jgi:hypothetical protein
MSDEFEHPDLEGLDPKRRATIESALKRTLESQLATSAQFGVDPVAAHSRSQGAFFSRSKTTDIQRAEQELDSRLLQHVTTLDDASFAKFAERLGSIKSGGQKG